MQQIDLLFDITHYLLNNSDEAKNIKAYLDDRIPENIQKEYKFGYMPSNDQLHLLTDVFSIKYLEDNNIIYNKIISGATTYINYFSNHNLIFPFYDAYNNFVSIVARSIHDSEKLKELKIGKYKYSMNYNKEMFVFGLNKAKNKIIDKDFVICVEGQFDYFALLNNGIENCVALGWANMTSYQFFEINKYTKNIFLMFDGDKAGLAGMKKAKNVYSKYANIKIISPISGFKDIDEYLRSNDNNKNNVLNYLKNGFKGFNEQRQESGKNGV